MVVFVGSLQVKMSFAMLKKFLGSSVVAAIVIAGSYAFVSPWLALKDFAQAFENQDTRKIEKLINFPELREDIKVTAKAALMKSAAVELEGDPFAAMGIMMANAIVDPIIDQIVSPAGLQLLFSAREMSGGTDGLPENINTIVKELTSFSDRDESNQETDAAQGIEIKTDYIGINEFEVQVTNSEILGESVSIYMRREGLGKWKVNGIRVPDSLVERLMDG